MSKKSEPLKHVFSAAGILQGGAGKKASGRLALTRGKVQLLWGN